MMNAVGEGVRNYVGSRYPFTASQWQELEHQALVYKYMISGLPIPPDLLFAIKASLDSSTRLLLHQQPPLPSIGWNYFQMGIGRKIDPEPGRCRRTDGKKWRCSKEAYPDSKYCEKHMHRGRNRSRKPVEVPPPPPPPPKTTIPMIPSSQHHFLLDPSSHRMTRNSYGMKEKMDEHSFFSESSGTIKASMEYSYQQQRQQKRQQQDHKFYYDQTDQLALKYDQKDEDQKVMHHFFDEWPPNDDNNNDSSTTQLSISIPNTARDFFLTHNDK